MIYQGIASYMQSNSGFQGSGSGIGNYNTRPFVIEYCS